MYLLNIRRKHVAGGTITRRSVATAVVTLPDNSYTYTGGAITPAVSVRLDGALLSVNEDYTVAYVNNTDIGLAAAVITGIGDFYGMVTKEFYITASGASWQLFDITKTGGCVATNYLMDVRATYNNNVRIDPYTIQVLADGRFHFGAQKQGHAYIWSFEDGHPFEVEHFKSLYVANESPWTLSAGNSRSAVVEHMGSEWISTDGTKGAYAYYDAPGVVPATFSTPFYLSTRGSGTEGSMGSGSSVCIGFSSDGMKFYHKPIAFEKLYVRYLGTAWDPTSGDFSNAHKGETWNEVSFNDVSGLSGVTWRSFTFSPDGTRLVVLSGSGAASVHVFSLSTPWDIGSLSYINGKQFYENNGHYFNAVAINASGSKMIIFDRGTGADGFVFREYNLTA